jgi:hypothetical protein
MGTYRAHALPLVLLAASLSCASHPSDVTFANSHDTGLEGTVVRGPVQPVCRIDIPCDAPFSAGFQVLQLGRLISRFSSDSTGHYQVPLPPGEYTVLADSTAPIWPKGQARNVTVEPIGVTHLDLSFDTGIR